MEATIHNLLEAIQNFAVHSNPLIGIMLGIGLIILESMIPVLPLALFIAMNTILFGNFWGFIISWVSTICGCMLSFYIFRKGISSHLYKHLPEDGHVLKFMRRITEIPFADLVVITAMPFTPAFTVNIAGGLSQISPRKFLAAIIIGKLPMVYFWGFIGSTFLESLENPIILLRIIAMLVIVYIISKMVSKKFHLE